MAHFLCILEPTRSDFLASPLPAELAKVDEHFRYLQGLLTDGTLILAGRTDEQMPTGFVILEAADEAEARRIVIEDPAVQAAVFQARLAPFRLALLRGLPPRA